VREIFLTQIVVANHTKTRISNCEKMKNDLTEDWQSLLNKKYQLPEYQNLFNDTKEDQPRHSNLSQNIKDNNNERKEVTHSSDSKNILTELIHSTTKYHHLLSKSIESSDQNPGDNNDNGGMIIHNHSTLFHQSSNQLQKQEYQQKLELFQKYDAIRFPSIPKVSLLPLLIKEEYKLSTSFYEEMIQQIKENPICSQSSHTNENLAGLNFLENMLLTFIDKVYEVRSLIIEHGNYLYTLKKPLIKGKNSSTINDKDSNERKGKNHKERGYYGEGSSEQGGRGGTEGFSTILDEEDDRETHSQEEVEEGEDDTHYISTIIINNLKTMKNNLQHLIEDMIIFQEQKVNEMINNNNNNSRATSPLPDISTAIDSASPPFSTSENDPISMLKQSLINRAMKLNDEITISLLSVEQLRLYALSLINYPPFPITPFEGFYSNWDRHIRLQKKHKVSPLSQGFAAFMLARNSIVSNPLFCFLQDPTSVTGYTSFLNFSFYSFNRSKNEFSLVIQFFLHEYTLTTRYGIEKGMMKKKTVKKDDNDDADADEAWDLFQKKQREVKEAKEKKKILLPNYESNPSNPYFQRLNNNGSVLHSIRTLILSHCSLLDTDCYSLSSILSKLLYLEYFDLSFNHLSYAGIASLVTAIFESKKVYLKQWYLDNNYLNADAATLLGQSLDHLPMLQYLSLNNNPIRDNGCYDILKHCLNKKRKTSLFFPSLERSKSGTRGTRTSSVTSRASYSTTATSPYDDNEEEEEGGEFNKEEGEEEEIAFHNDDEDEEEEEVEEIVSQHKKPLKSRYPKNCYYQDYYSGYLSKEMLRAYQANKIQERNKQLYQWVNYDNEEFDMDIPSEYSSSQEEEEDKEEHGDEEEEEDETEGEGEQSKESSIKKKEKKSKKISEKHLTYEERLLQNEKASLLKVHSDAILTLEEYIASYPKLVKVLLRVRVKLAAISMFKQFSSRGHPSLMGLSFNGCSLSSSILPILSTVYCENMKLTILNLSNNQNLLAMESSCSYIATIIKKSSLSSLCISSTGLDDYGLAVIANAMSSTASASASAAVPSSTFSTVQREEKKGVDLEYIELSNNKIGGTGAAIIANLAKEYGCEKLTIGSGPVKSAPFPMKKYPWSDYYLEKKRRKEERMKLKKEKMKKGRKSIASRSKSEFDDDDDDDDSFVDYDSFEGEEEGDDNDDDGEEGENGEDEDQSIFTKKKQTTFVIPENSGIQSFIPKMFKSKRRSETDSASLASRLEML
jgi:hypothetical protein